MLGPFLVIVLTFAVGLAPAPASARRDAPVVRGLYMSGWVASDVDWRADLFTLANERGLDAVVIDLKDSSGRIFDEIDASAVAAAHDAHLYTIARIVCFEDPVIAAAHPESVFRVGGRVWTGESGLPWIDPRSAGTRSALTDVVRLAARIGFDEVQLDYVRFPTGRGADELDRGTEATRVAAISAFLGEMRDALPASLPLSADVFGLTTTAVDDMTIGQDLARIASVVDVVSPMMYPSHYAPQSYGLQDPDAAPHAVVDAGLADGLAKLDGRTAKLRPWLQAFSLRHLYGSAQVRAQIDAVTGRGVKSYLLWDPANRYDALR